MARFVIVYHSTTGNTRALAEAVAEGARSLKIEAELIDAFDAKAGDVLAAEAVGFGVPTFNYAPAKPITRLLDDLAGRDVDRTAAVVFGSYGWSGQGPVAVAGRLRGFGFDVLDPVIRVRYQPAENELFGCSLLGKDVAMRLKNIKKTESLEA